MVWESRGMVWENYKIVTDHRDNKRKRGYLRGIAKSGLFLFCFFSYSAFSLVAVWIRKGHRPNYTCGHHIIEALTWCPMTRQEHLPANLKVP